MNGYCGECGHPDGYHGEGGCSMPCDPGTKVPFTSRVMGARSERCGCDSVDAAAPHLTADLVRERDEALAQVEHWKRMAKRREEALDALGAERNTWARQMADLNDECDATRRVKDDAEARMRDALNERDDALNRAEKAEAAIARVEAALPATDRDIGYDDVAALVYDIRAALRGDG